MRTFCITTHESLFISQRASGLSLDIPWPAVPEEMSEEAYDLINRLLEPNPSERLGANGVEEIKSHPFFADINWDTLYLEPRTSTFVPRTKDRYDTGYFVPRQDGSDDSFASSFTPEKQYVNTVPPTSDTFRSPYFFSPGGEELFAGFSYADLSEAIDDLEIDDDRNSLRESRDSRKSSLSDDFNALPRGADSP